MDFGKHLVVDIETGNQVYVDLTPEEIAERQRIADEIAIELATKEQLKVQQEQEASAAKAAAEAKLAALGLTADDLKALGLGGN